MAPPMTVTEEEIDEAGTTLAGIIKRLG